MMERTIDIKKVDGRWMAIRDDRQKKHPRGQPLKWVLHPDPAAPGKPISAHFQFADSDLVENLEKNVQLTPDWTAMIPEPGKHLSLKVKDKACRRKNPRHYAIWIVDSDFQPAGGVFAVGESGNPPPEMEIGPG